MTTNPYDFLASLAKSSLPTVLIFILGWAITGWCLGDDQISFSKLLPLVIASISSVSFLGLQWLWKEKTSWGHWYQESWEDEYDYPQLDERTDYGKFKWRLQIEDKEPALVGAWCKKCRSMALLDKHSKRRKVRIVCSAGCFRQKMVFKGTIVTVMDYITRQLVNLLSEKDKKTK